MSVILSVYATIEPAALPLPGPTMILFSLEKFIKSQTIKNTLHNPFFQLHLIHNLISLVSHH